MDRQTILEAMGAIMSFESYLENEISQLMVKNENMFKIKRIHDYKVSLGTLKDKLYNSYSQTKIA